MTGYCKNKVMMVLSYTPEHLTFKMVYNGFFFIPLENHKHFYRKNPFSVNSMNVPYDYDSITHMSRWYLGKRNSNGNIMETIVTLDRKKKYSIGQRSHLSHSDILQLNLLYKCSGKHYLLL